MNRKVSSGIQHLLKWWGALPLALTGIALVFWAIKYLLADQDAGIAKPFKVATGIVGVVLIICGLIILFKRRIRHPGLLLSAGALTGFYLLAEFTTWLLIMAGVIPSRKAVMDASFGVFNSPCAVMDTISGYKWLHKPCRMVKIVEGEVIFDNTFLPNKQGYISEQDYTYSKNDSNVIRFIVFGDSFTTGEFNGRSWVDITQEMLDSLAGGRKIELYNFAVDGGGLVNWYRIFFHEIIPNYEFDGVIFAVWGNDFARDFAIMHHYDREAYFYYFKTVPRSFDDFEKNYLPEMWMTAPVIPDDSLNRMIDRAMTLKNQRFHFEVPDLNLLMKCYDLVEKYRFLRKQQRFRDKYVSIYKELPPALPVDSFINRYGMDKFIMLDTMVRYCKKAGNSVIFALLADEYGIRFLQTDNARHWGQIEVAGLARHYDAAYFDGLEVFVPLDDAQIEKSFLKYDTHWSRYGSSIFARHFARYLYHEYGIKDE